MAGRYDDIIHLSRPVSRRSPLPMEERAAQFSPFAALTGYEDVIEEAARLTASPRILGEDAKEELSRRLTLLAEKAPERPTVEITWFQPDELKVGGAYVTQTVTVRRVDDAYGLIELADMRLTPIDRIYDLRGDIFLDA